MRIAMIGHKRIPSREGGIEIVVEALSTKMVQIGHDVTVYNRKGAHVSGVVDVMNSPKAHDYQGVRIIWIPTFQAKSLNAIVYAVLATFHALFGKYDVIHFHAEGSCAMLWLPKLFRIRTVATIHGLDWQRAKWGGFATRFLLFGEKMAVRHADELIVLSKNVQDYFWETYQRKTTYIPNGITIPEKKSPHIIKEKYHLFDQYILFLARIVPEKGLHYLIEAYQKLNLEQKLVIAGGSSHTDEYLEQIKEMVKDNPNIIMTGFVQGEELAELYSNCALYVLPSDIEGMPLSLLEALSYGRTCLVSDIPENMEVLANLGYSFHKGDIEDLKKKMADILNTENQQERCLEIQNSVKSRFDWNRVTDETITLYR